MLEIEAIVSLYQILAMSIAKTKQISMITLQNLTLRIMQSKSKFHSCQD